MNLPSASKAIRSQILVFPDNEMRERERKSLNRLPDIHDWVPEGPLTDIYRVFNQPVCIHRKAWEYALSIHGLTTLGAVRPESVGLAVGAGTEPPLYYFANKISRMVATDLYESPDHEGNPAMLRDPRAFAPFAYRENCLEVYKMSGDSLIFPAQTFDFVFCLSSIEHFGSRDNQRRSLAEMARVLKPGGIACIITELILNHGRDNEYFTYEEIQQIFLQNPLFNLVGGDVDLSISASLVDYPVDITLDYTSPNTRKSPHIVLKRNDLIWTSFSMFLRRNEKAL